jgi:hypothetical protein
MWKPLRRNILYVKWRASNIYSVWSEKICVTVVKHIFVLWVVKKCVFWQKTINCQLYILLELEKLLRNLDHTLNKALCISSYSVPLLLEDWGTPNYSGGLGILRCYIATRDTSSDYLPKVRCGGKIIFSNRSFARTALAIWHLLNNFILSFTV